MLGIYVHLPFCPYLCPYCDFAKWPMRASSASRYLEALYAELENEPRADAATIFLGGGTPNAYDSRTVTQLVGRLRERFPGEGQEISIEINPELVRDGDFAAYRSAGITRVSIGVQSFDATEIRTLGRKHTPEQVAAVVANARDARLPSISLDLIFAVPGQTPQSWRGSLERAIQLGVDHISCYGLTVEEATPYADWQRREPAAFADDSQEAELFAIAIDTLESAGYEQYEISNFARPGHACRHNLNYWANGDYVGLGVGAASYRHGVRSVHTRALEAYVEAAMGRAPIPADAERLDGSKRAGEAVMLALRTKQGVQLDDFKERYGIDPLQFYAPVIARYQEIGLLEHAGNFMRLTKRGRFLANDVCGAFVTFE
jgi:oxygen-independent coproporphyrinogen III oxidase